MGWLSESWSAYEYLESESLSSCHGEADTVLKCEHALYLSTTLAELQ